MAEKESPQRGLITVILCLFIEMTGNYAAFQISPISVRVMEEMGMNEAQFSSCFTAPMIPSIFLCFVAGMIIDRLGIKKVMGIGLLIASVGGILRVLAGDYITFLIALILSGIPVAFANVTASKVAAAYYTGKKAALVVGISIGACSLGTFLALSTTALFENIKIPFALSAALFILIAIMWLLFVKEIPKHETLTTAEFKKSLPVILKNRGVWLSCAVVGLAVTVITFITGSLPAALQNRSISESSAGAIVSFFSIGNAIGDITIPVIARKINKKILLAFLTIIVGACSIFAWTLPLILVIVLMVIIGMGTGGLFATMFSLAPTSKQLSQYSGTINGIIGSLQMAMGTVIPSYMVIPLVGNNYSVLFLVAGLCMLPALLSALCFPKDY